MSDEPRPLNSSATASGASNSGASNSGVKARLDRLAARAGRVLLFERLWPVAVWLLSIAAVFVAVSWLGLWLEVPRWGRIGGVLLFGLAALAALAPLLRLRAPTRAQELARLDRDAGVAHRPASSLDDRLANAGDDPGTRALWELHRRRLEESAAALQVKPPSPRMVDRDRYALRGAALVALAAAAFVAGPEKYARILTAFDWQTPGAISQGFRIDAWIDPPPYTGRPPIMLTGQDKEPGARPGQKIPAPVGSVVVVRTSGTGGFSAQPSGGLVLAEAEKTAGATAPGGPSAQPASAPVKAPASPDDEGQRWTLRGDGKLTLRRYGSTLATFDISAIPDKPPVIALKGEPRNNIRGSLTLQYHVEDDYGVVGAQADFSRPIINDRPVTGHPLVDPPHVALGLPAGAGGDAETTADLAESPWAGVQVTMTLSAKDEGGNTGFSDPVQMTLPQRTFTKPVARALVEQRRRLVIAPDQRRRVYTAMEALMIAPDRFGTTPAVYLGLHAIAGRLADAQTDKDLIAVADLMWAMALRIEDGDLSQAERDLRAAQQALREALQRHAPPEELKKLMDQMRAALDKFMNELAQQQQRDQQNQQQSRLDRNSRTITQQDLKSMLDRMEDMAKSGDTADAQRMLDELQNMLENLQTAQRGQMDPATRQMNQALNDLDKMTRDQQQLRDKTFQQSQRERRGSQNAQRRRQGERGMQSPGDRQDEDMQDGENDDQSADDGEQPGDQAGDQTADQDSEALRQQQRNLRQRLEDLQRKMKQLGMKGSKGFDDAQDAMQDAEGDLREGRKGQGRAVDAQGRALEGLRRGAQQLAQQMQENGQGQGQQGGPGSPGGPMQQGRNGNADPLGRDTFGRLNPQSRYEPYGVPAAQRAQRVLEELRRRLGNPGRPQEELDYLERLLKPF